MRGMCCAVCPCVRVYVCTCVRILGGGGTQGMNNGWVVLGLNPFIILHSSFGGWIELACLRACLLTCATKVLVFPVESLLVSNKYGRRKKKGLTVVWYCNLRSKL